MDNAALDMVDGSVCNEGPRYSTLLQLRPQGLVFVSLKHDISRAADSGWLKVLWHLYHGFCLRNQARECHPECHPDISGLDDARLKRRDLRDDR